MHQLQEEREDILRTASLDLRSPLTTILGQAQRVQLGLEKGAPPERLHAGIDAVVIDPR